MLLSLDWDAYSGCRELVFDAPIWGTPDRPHDRLEAWRRRALKRDAQAAGWDVLGGDFPLYPGWEAPEQYAGLPVFAAWSHAHAWAWLKRFPGREVLNIDSHHDLYSLSGDAGALRPGNWAGLALSAGLVTRYTAAYPAWHAQVPVAEGYDLERARAEVAAHLSAETLTRVRLSRAAPWPPRAAVESLLLVQSPSWTSPAHDPAFLGLVSALGATLLSTPPLRTWAAQARLLDWEQP